MSPCEAKNSHPAPVNLGEGRGVTPLRLHRGDQRWQERTFWIFRVVGPLNLGHPPLPPPPPPPGSRPFGGQPRQRLPPTPSSACSFLAESASRTSARRDSEQGWGLEPGGSAEVMHEVEDPPKAEEPPQIPRGPPSSQPPAALALTTSPLLPSCPSGAFSQAGWGRGEVSYSSWGEAQGTKNIVYMARLLPPLPGGPEGLIGGGLAGTPEPNIPVDRCSPGTPAFLLPSPYTPSL